MVSGLIEPSCDPFAFSARSFIESFEKGSWGSLNHQPGYADVLGAALATTVATTCEAVGVPH